ncbi:hypothetical protein RQP46_005196 [Phenoliferia psychrophenolica]
MEESLSVPSSSSPPTASAAASAATPGSRRLDQHAFDHPAGYEDQRIVWIPADAHGFYKHEVEATQAAEVEVSSEGATLDLKGHVDVTRSPPGDEWNAED